MKTQKWIPYGFVIAFAATGSLFASQEKNDAWKDTISTMPPGDFPMLEPCTLQFNVSWNGVVKAGQADIKFKVAEDGDHRGALETSGEAKSTGVARALWPYKAKIRSVVDSKTLKPIFIQQAEMDRQEQNHYETKFIGDFIFNKHVMTPNEGERERKEKVYETGPRMHDLVSAILYIRSFPLDEDGKTYRMVTFPFNSRYLVELTQEGREQFKYRGEKVDSIKFDVVIKKIMKNDDLKSYEDKVKKAHVWVSDDDLRLPLELRAEIFVGSVRATLAEHQWH
ncbi:MAG: DUF3108 domain-containing protein [Verrucomicrobiota bacterium]